MTQKQLETMGPYDRIVLLGGGTALRKLCLWAKDNGYTVGVITSSRHAVELNDSEDLATFLKKNGISFLVTDTIETPEVKEFLSLYRGAGTFFLSLGAAWIFKKAVIEKYFDGNLFNAHGTRLPQNRGGGGFSWQILTGNRFGFCLIHRIDEGVDTGDVLVFDEFLYPASCRIPEDYMKVYESKTFLFITELLQHTRHKEIIIAPLRQAHYLSTYWPRLHTPTNAWIDWGLDAEEIERFICAFDSPYPGAQAFVNGRKVAIKSASLNFQDGSFHPYQSGIIYRKGKSWICVCAGRGGLIIERVVDEQGIDVLDSLNVGERFYTPVAMLEQSASRVAYTPKGLQGGLM